MDLEKLRYPIGHYTPPENITTDILEGWISILEHFPNRLEQLVIRLSEEQLDTTYRPGGWTVKQVVHHVYDSHHNSYNRFKWALTENMPLIKAYNEADWAKGADYRLAPISLSLDALKTLHAKLVFLLKNMSHGDFQKEFIHPEGNKRMSLAYLTGMYAWHSNHHYAHIANLVEREGWN